MHAAMPAYFTREYIRQVQMALNEKTKMNLPTTGRFNAGWAELLKRVQIENGLLPTAKYDQDTQELLEPFIQMKYLQDGDFEEAAALLGCEKEAIKAVARTAMYASGFISSGKCRITFKRERFYQELRKRLSEEEIKTHERRNPSVVAPNGGGYLCDDYEYVRFCAAVSIDSYAAMVSTSWGMFQLPGANYRQCGYTAVASFAMDMQHSERRQMLALAKFIKASPTLLKAIREKDWNAFCLRYFGDAYSLYQYDQRMRSSYTDLTRQRKASIAA